MGGRDTCPNCAVVAEIGGRMPNGVTVACAIHDRPISLTDQTIRATSETMTITAHMPEGMSIPLVPIEIDAVDAHAMEDLFRPAKASKYRWPEPKKRRGRR